MTGGHGFGERTSAESAEGAREYRVVYTDGCYSTGFTDEDEAVSWSEGYEGARVEWRTPWTALASEADRRDGQ